ncbi:MAG: DNA translocase FtsK [Lachnospiraceae bacterium]|nr:DNA translocase FtsK [Lachnospiraceae bacterium]
MPKQSEEKKKKSSRKSGANKGSSASSRKKAGTSTRKKSSSSKTKTAAKERTVDESRESLSLDLIVLVSLTLSVLLFIGEVGGGGVVLDTVSRFTFGLFGLTAYLLPFILFLGTLLTLANRESPSFRVRVISLGVFFIFLMALLELLKTDGLDSGLASYFSSYQEKNGGGLLGGLIAGALYKGLGTIAAYFIVFIGLIVSILFFFGKSMIRRAEHKGRNLKKRRELSTAEREKRRELNAERAERMQRAESDRRAERVGRGVSLDTALVPEDSKASSDEMSELTSETLGNSSEADTSYRDAESVQLSGTTVKESVPMSASEMASGQIAIEQAEKEPLSSEEKSYIFGAGNGNAAAGDMTDTDNPAESLFFPPEEMPVIENDDAASIPAESDENADISEMTFEEQDIQSAVEEKAVPESLSASSPAHTEIPAVESDLPAPEENAKSPEAVLKKAYVLPDVNLLDISKNKNGKDSAAAINKMAEKLQTTLSNFGVNAKVTNYMQGPAVTRFEIEPETGVKVSKILNLSDDIKLNLAVPDIRMEAPIPGKAAIGIEVPNKQAQTVTFRELMESKEFQSNKSKIAFAAGRDIAGNIVISDISKMPHLLIAGATGSGKSVCINTIIMSILYKATPDEVRFIMIDPKIVELSVYNGIPHLLVPVVTDPKKAAGALQWAVTEMTTRYKRFADAAVRDMKAYNAKVKTGEIVEDGKPVTEPMPQIVVIVDELADLMMVAGKEVEASICRLAQLARAAGIHLIIATQRPSADVITGLIKANMPSRIAFAVTSGIDSRVVLDMSGAEKLLGKGDMLYFPQGMSKPLRVQGAFVSDDEVGRVCDFIRTENAAAVETALSRQEETQSAIESHEETLSADTTAIDGNGRGVIDDGRDEFFPDAGKLACEKGKISIGMMQRAFRIGFNRAARIMDQLDEAGVVGPDLGTKPRTVLMKPEEFQAYLDSEGGDS